MNIALKNKKAVVGLLVSLALVLFVGALILFNTGIHKTPLRADNGTTFEKAKVVEVITDNAFFEDNGEFGGNQLVTVRLLSGEHKGENCTAQNPNSYLSGTYCVVGTPVIVMLSENGNGLAASVYNYDRGMVLWLLVALFIVVLCVIGGRKGISSAVALIFTFACILFLYLPMMYVGFSPFFAATIVCVLTTVVTMLLINGWSVKTLCSILGTVAGVLIAGLVATIFGTLSHISGFNVKDIESIIYVSQNSKLHVGGVMYSGILIASLGAVMDVSISVVSAMSEIHRHNPKIHAKELFRSGINVGRDMMGTMSNTLILAFTGGSINTLILIYSYNMPYLQTINQYAIGIEILRGLSGTLGVILTVPLVSAITSMMLTRKNPRE